MRLALAAWLMAAIAAPLWAQQAKQPDLPRLMNPRIVAAMPAANPAKTVRYGEGESQIAELFLPAKREPDSKLPVVVMVHGGCWRKTVAGIALLRPAATAFIEQGYAVWSIGYRRIDEEGGGYPGTYQDVGSAIDALKVEAEEHGLDLSRTVFWGHSAGAHLALWAAARHRLPETSVLHVADPLRPRGVVGVGGIGSLQKWEGEIDTLCGAGTVAALIPAADGDGEEAQAARFAEVSPERMLPLGVESVMLHGVFDAAAFPAIGLDFVADARRAGDRSDVQVAPVAGHFEVIAPGTPAFNQGRAAVDRLAKQ